MKQITGPLAHAWLEQRTHNPLVQGSTPWGPTTDDIIDAEFEEIIDAEWTEVREPSWQQRQAQIAYYKYIQNLARNKMPKIIDTLA